MDTILLDERNQLAWEVGNLQSAIGVFASIYEKLLEAKGENWCRENEDLPLDFLRGFKMPTLDHCRKAKLAAEGRDIHA